MNDPRIEDVFPLSPTQAGMVFRGLNEPGIFQVQAAYRIEGALDEELFERSWNRLLARHSILRASFLRDGIEEPLQAVWREVTIRVARNDLSELSREERGRCLEAASGSTGPCRRSFSVTWSSSSNGCSPTRSRPS